MSNHSQQPSNSLASWFRLLLTQGPAWITAIVGAVAALGIGFGAGYGTSTAQNSRPAPTITVTAKASPGTSSPPAPAGSNGTPSTVPSNGSPTPTIRHEGPLTLNNGAGADLDSLAANWGVPDLSSLGDADITLGSSVIGTGSGQLAKLDNFPPNYPGCSSTTDYVGSISNLHEGATFCVKTDQGRFILVHVTKISQDATSGSVLSMSFVVTTWENVGSS